MRTDCGDPDTATEVIKNLCQDKHECEVKVEEDIFADVDCDDTTKYLEVQWQCQDLDNSQPRLPNLEGNITSVWNSQDRSLSREDLEQALKSAGKEDAEDKKKKELDSNGDDNAMIEMHSIPSAFIHENVKEDDDIVLSSDIEVVPTESEKYPTDSAVYKDDMTSMIVPIAIITTLVIILAGIAVTTNKVNILQDKKYNLYIYHYFR